jgi:hypothetical protein
LREDRDKGELREQEVISLIGIGDPLQRLEHGISERSLLYRQQILSLEQEEEGLGEVHVQQGALDWFNLGIDDRLVDLREVSLGKRGELSTEGGVEVGEGKVFGREGEEKGVGVVAQGWRQKFGELDGGGESSETDVFL